MSKPACQICSCLPDKADRRFVDSETFAYSEHPPKGVSDGLYCTTCYENLVEPALLEYEETLEKAKNVNMFYASQSKESRFIRRIERPITVQNCSDRDEAILKLAFITVQSGKNAMVDVDLKSAKVRIDGYQTSTWSGRAIPVQIEESVLQRRFAGAPN
ncbi:MAG: hypothetical protein AB7F86_04020 [Bdellovibrionales bacterium]